MKKISEHSKAKVVIRDGRARGVVYDPYGRPVYEDIGPISLLGEVIDNSFGVVVVMRELEYLEHRIDNDTIWHWLPRKEDL